MAPQPVDADLTAVAAHLIFASRDDGDPHRVAQLIWDIPELDRVTLIAMLAKAVPIETPVGALQADTHWLSEVTREGLLRAHSQYVHSSIRTDSVIDGERTYQRRRQRRKSPSSRVGAPVDALSSNASEAATGPERAA